MFYNYVSYYYLFFVFCFFAIIFPMDFTNQIAHNLYLNSKLEYHKKTHYMLKRVV